MCLLAAICAGLVSSEVRICRGCAAPTITSRRTAFGRIVAAVQARPAPQPWPISTALDSPRARITPVTSMVRVSGS
jgi:hypothetical protein